MKLKQLFTEEDAVSPVIGVILMVAITVILAAVIGTFVLGLGDQVSDSAPQASFSFDYEESASMNGNVCNAGSSSSGNQLTVTHDGGAKIAAGRLDIVGDAGTFGWEQCSSLTANSDVTAGTSAYAQVDGGDEARIVWTASGGGDSATLIKWTGPDA